MTAHSYQKMVLKEDDLIQKSEAGQAQKANVLTLTEEPSPSDGKIYFWIRLDGNFIKCFDEEQRAEAERFFRTYKKPAGPKLIAERILEEAPEDPALQVPQHYRGCTITRKPYNGTPFTVEYRGQVVDHQDEETLREIFDSLDVYLDELQASDANANVEPMPAWRVQYLELRAMRRGLAAKLNA